MQDLPLFRETIIVLASLHMADVFLLLIAESHLIVDFSKCYVDSVYHACSPLGRFNSHSGYLRVEFIEYSSQLNVLMVSTGCLSSCS